MSAQAAAVSRPQATTAHLPRWDWPLLGTTVVLMALGLLMILSSSSLSADAVYGDALHYVIRQAAGLALGGVIGIAVLMTPYRWLRRGAWPAYGFSIFLLALVMTPLGYSANGATRWISLGFFNFQPSELAKVTLILVLAQYLACNEGRLRDWMGVVVPGLSLLVPMLVMMAFQRDFGTTVILIGLVGVLFFVAGLRWRWVFGLAGCALSGLVLMVLVEPYRMKRLVSFIDPYADPSGAGYQVVQGWIALAAGGWTGQGLATGVAQRGFLPEAHTDFVSAVVGEELGAVGWMLIVVLYVVLLWRGMRVASHAPDFFGLLVSTAVTTLLAAQVLINLGVVCGMLPAKGLVLPFISYGASAAVVHVICVALLLRISMETAAVGAMEELSAPEAA